MPIKGRGRRKKRGGKKKKKIAGERERE